MKISYLPAMRAGRASDYIRHAPEEIKPGDKLILACRVSECEQDRKGNLADQEANLRERAENLGAIVLRVVSQVESGYKPWWVGRAVFLAKQYGAKIFAESTDRLIRTPAFDKKNQDAQARDSDLRYLVWWSEGVVLATDLHPDATPKETRSYQRKRGQRMKGNRGGRPSVLNDRRALARAVGRLLRKQSP